MDSSFSGRIPANDSGPAPSSNPSTWPDSHPNDGRPPSASALVQETPSASLDPQSTPSSSAATPGAAAPATQTPAQNSSGSNNTSKSKYGITDQVVLDYLKKKGIGSAVLELTRILEQEEEERKRQQEESGQTASATGDSTGTNDNKQEVNQEEQSKQQPRDTTTLDTKSARERLDEDDALTRNQRSLLTKSTGGGYGYDRDAAWPVIQWGIPDCASVLPLQTTTAQQQQASDGSARPSAATPMGLEEARAYVAALVELQLWVLSLPDHHGRQLIDNPIRRAQKSLRKKGPSMSAAELLQEMVPTVIGTSRPHGDHDDEIMTNLPPSIKAELLSVAFALLVHTYCELLEVGMESTALAVRDAFKPVYEPLYPSEYRDLFLCKTTEDMMKLNSYNSQHMEALSTLKTISIQKATYQLRREELHAQSVMGDPQKMASTHQKIQEYDRTILQLDQKYADLSNRASQAFGKMHYLPFLRRARAVRWQLYLSTHSYAHLVSFLNRGMGGDSLLPASALLQSKCELHVERRDPLPLTPACVFVDEVGLDQLADPASQGLLKDIQWGAPAPRWFDQEELPKEKIPFPKYHLDSEYDTEEDAERDKAMVEFNRSVLVNGFRRLEALERKREYDALPKPDPNKRLKEDDPPGLNTQVGNALKPSILLMTLSSSTSGPVLKKPIGTIPSSQRGIFTDVSSIWEESGIGLCCAKVCQPDGRRIAVGCDDSSIRIWDVQKSDGEPTQVLFGHKNGFPVFDVDWNRDGRTLLSAGGDGSIRLWDTAAVGPYGDLATSSTVTQDSLEKLSTLPPGTTDMSVSGLRPEKVSYSSGAALAVYRGHAPSSPVWSVAFAPCGYYFCSTASDGTARLWTTDRPVPVRLFTGHTSNSVNCVAWHPNCNYVATGADDKTVRLWDIQSGQTVRLMTGCSKGINAIKISPSGQHVAASDHGGSIHLWDLGTGAKLTEFKASPRPNGAQAMVHCLDFSRCGQVLATGGDDGAVRIWDVRPSALSNHPLIEEPWQTFPTVQTLLLDLQYTKRNLLLSVGKYVSAAP